MRLIVVSDDANMSRQSRRHGVEHTPEALASWLNVVWAMVLLQGAILVATSLESLVISIGTGFVTAPTLLLTSAAAVLTLMTAKGLRRRRRWARRVTIVSEWLVLLVGGAEVIATIVLVGSAPQLMPVAVTVIIPLAVLVCMRRVRPLFVADSGAKPARREDGISTDETMPLDHAMLGPVS